MKTMKLNGMIALLGIAFIGVIACKDGESAKNPEKVEATASEESPEAINAEVMSPVAGVETEGVIQSYMTLKDALVASDQKKAGDAASALVSSISSLQAISDFGDKQEGLNTILDKAASNSELIAKADLVQQRSHFKSLNEDIAGMLAVTGSTIKLYEQYCPMYNNNQGGTWLSMEEEIMNPYFGDQMLHCGKVTRVISQK